MASNLLIGVITEIKETEVVSEKFSKREFLLTEINEQYPQTIPFIFTQDKCSILDGYNVGNQVNVSYNIRSNEYKGKYYVNLNAWRIEMVAPAAPQPVSQPPVIAQPTAEDDSGDLPF